MHHFETDITQTKQRCLHHDNLSEVWSKCAKFIEKTRLSKTCLGENFIGYANDMSKYHAQRADDRDQECEILRSL